MKVGYCIDFTGGLTLELLYAAIIAHFGAVPRSSSGESCATFSRGREWNMQLVDAHLANLCHSAASLDSNGNRPKNDRLCAQFNITCHMEKAKIVIFLVLRSVNVCHTQLLECVCGQMSVFSSGLVR